MGKKLKIIIAVVFFPIAIVFLFLKLLDKKRFNKYLENISIRDIDGLDGHVFEDVMYELFKSCKLKVEKTPKSRDYGADLVITTKYEKIVIQCKLYFNHNVGNSAVQEINTAKNYYDATIGLVITNSFFTKPAKTLAESNGVKLIDRDGLIEFLSSNKKNKKNIIETL